MIARFDPSALEEDLGDDAIKAGGLRDQDLKYIVANMNDWFVDDTDGSHRENLYNEILGIILPLFEKCHGIMWGYLSDGGETGYCRKDISIRAERLQRNSFVGDQAIEK